LFQALRKREKKMNFSNYFYTLLLLILFKNGESLNSTTLSLFNTYFRYHKCQTTDAIMYCENCSSYQPSCTNDSNCLNGLACCEASCYPSKCYSCQCNFIDSPLLCLINLYNHFLKQNVLFKTYLNATRDFFVI
jgi:hypothetical protein